MCAFIRAVSLYGSSQEDAPVLLPGFDSKLIAKPGLQQDSPTFVTWPMCTYQEAVLLHMPHLSHISET